MAKTILIHNYEYPPIGGGAANATYYIAHHLGSSGHQVIILTSAFETYNGISQEGSVTIYRIKTFRRYQYKAGVVQMLTYIMAALLHLPKIRKRFQPDVQIAFFSIPSGIVAWVYYLFYRKPYLVSLRGGDVPGTEKSIAFFHTLIAPLRRSLLRNSKNIIANSKGLATLSEKYDPIPVEIIPNGVDAKLFQGMTEYGIKQNGIYSFIFVGRLHQQKNIHTLIHQFAYAYRFNNNIRLSIIGDGQLRIDLERLVIQLGVDKAVIFAGWQDKAAIISHLQQADCFINPSLYEGMPNTVLEAMATGLPVIASDIFGNNDLVYHKENGLLFPLERPDRLGHYIRIMAKYSQLKKEYGVKSRLIVETKYSWDKIAQAYDILLHS